MIKKTLSIALVIIMAASLTACGGKSDTGDETLDKILSSDKKTKDEMITTMYYQNQDLQAQVNDLNTMVKGIQGEEVPSANIGITGDGTGRYTFNSNDSKIIFGEGFGYPDAQQIAPNGSINIVEKISVETGNNWIYKMTGSALELENTSGISGTIKASAIDNVYETDELQNDVLGVWFSELPPSTINYTKIFVNNKDYGVQAITPTLIDSEDAVLTVGMVGFGKYAVTYIFVYRGTQDSNKDEAIRTTVESIQMNGQKLLVGFN